MTSPWTNPESNPHVAAAMKDLSRVRDDMLFEGARGDWRSAARKFERDYRSGVRDTLERAAELRQVASLGGDLQRQDIDDLRRWAQAHPREARVSKSPSASELIAAAQSWIASVVNAHLTHAPSVFAPIPNTRGFAIQREPDSVLPAIYAHLAHRLSRGDRISVCANEACHAVITRDDKRPQRFCDNRCEMQQWYRDHPEIKEKRRKARAQGRRARKGARS